MNELIKLIEKTADAFYQQHEEEGYRYLNIVIEQLLHFNNRALDVKLALAIDAMQRKDTILLADVLLYEIKDLFE